VKIHRSQLSMRATPTTGVQHDDHCNILAGKVLHNTATTAMARVQTCHRSKSAPKLRQNRFKYRSTPRPGAECELGTESMANWAVLQQIKLITSANGFYSKIATDPSIAPLLSHSPSYSSIVGVLYVPYPLACCPEWPCVPGRRNGRFLNPHRPVFEDKS
jgi:hypothetical protein